MDKKTKDEVLTELGGIEKLLAGAIDKDDFGSGLSMRRVPQISYVALKRITALLRKILD